MLHRNAAGARGGHRSISLARPGPTSSRARGMLVSSRECGGGSFVCRAIIISSNGLEITKLLTRHTCASLGKKTPCGCDPERRQLRGQGLPFSPGPGRQSQFCIDLRWRTPHLSQVESAFLCNLQPESAPVACCAVGACVPCCRGLRAVWIGLARVGASASSGADRWCDGSVEGHTLGREFRVHLEVERAAKKVETDVVKRSQLSAMEAAVRDIAERIDGVKSDQTYLRSRYDWARLGLGNVLPLPLVLPDSARSRHVRQRGEIFPHDRINAQACAVVQRGAGAGHAACDCGQPHLPPALLRSQETCVR